MKISDTFRRMDKRLRITLLATALLLPPQIGQFMAVRDINTSGHEGDITMVLMFLAVFLVPTSLILSGVVAAVVRRQGNSRQPILVLAAINALIALNLIWFFFHPCSWAQVFGLALRNCTH